MIPAERLTTARIESSVQITAAGKPTAELQQLCLPGVVEAAGDAPVLFDSGVRGGEDVVKALALGA